MPGGGITVDTYPSLEAAGIQLLRVAALRHTAGQTSKFVDKLRREVMADLNQIALEYMDGDELGPLAREVLLFTDHYQIPKNIVFTVDKSAVGVFNTSDGAGGLKLNALVTARWQGWCASKGFQS